MSEAKAETKEAEPVVSEPVPAVSVPSSPDIIDNLFEANAPKFKKLLLQISVLSGKILRNPTDANAKEMEESLEELNTMYDAIQGRDISLPGTDKTKPIELKLLFTPVPNQVSAKCANISPGAPREYTASQILGASWFGVADTAGKGRAGRALATVKESLKIKSFPGIVINKDSEGYPNVQSIFGNLCSGTGNECILQQRAQYNNWRKSKRSKNYGRFFIKS